MNKQFCDNCKKPSEDRHIDSINTDDGKHKVELTYNKSGHTHLWSPTDLCEKCKHKILKEIANKIIQELSHT